MQYKARFFYGYLIVIISFIVMMAILGLHTSFGIFFKPIIAELGWTRAVTSGAYSLSQIMHGVLGVAMGWLNDRAGPRVVISLCGLLSAMGYMLMSQVEAVWQIYLFYGILIGSGSSVFVPLLSTVARWFVLRRSMMTGVVIAGVGVGMLVLPPLLNQLIVAYNWRVTFFMLGAIILVVVVVVAQFLKRDPAKVGQGAYGAGSGIGEGMRAAGRDFSLREAVRNRQYWLFCATLFCYGFCVFSIQVHIAPYATDIGISAATASIILATIGGATVIGQVGLGSAGDRIGYRQAFLIGIILIVLAVLTLILAREIWAFFLFAFLLGLAFGDCSTQESPITAWLFGLASHGLILGFFGFGFTAGAAMGPWIFGYIFDVTGKYQSAFILCAVLAVAAVILTVLLKRPVAESASTAGPGR